MAKIGKNLLYNGLLTCAQYIFPLVVFPYVTRVLGVANIGLVGFIDSIVTYFILFSMMGISVVGVREVARCGKDVSKRSSVFFNLLTLHALMTLLMLSSIIVLTFTLDALKDDRALMGVGICKLIFNLFLVEWFFRGVEDFKFITLRSLIIRGSYVVAVFIFVRKPEDTLTYYFLTMLVVVVTAVVNMSFASSLVSPRKWKLNIIPFLRPFFALGVYELMVSAYTTLNTAFLGFSTNDTEVGYYVTAMKLISILSGVFVSFSGVMLPRMSALISQGETDIFINYLKRCGLVVIGFTLPVIAVFEIFAPEVIHILAGQGYEGAVAPLRIMSPFLMVLGFEQLLMLQVLTPMGREKDVLYVTIVAALAGVVLNIVLVPRLGAVGSAWVWAAAETLILIGAGVASYRALYLQRPNSLL